MSTIKVPLHRKDRCCSSGKTPFARCGCGNSRPWDRPLCDRCQALKERGWKLTHAEAQ